MKEKSKLRQWFADILAPSTNESDRNHGIVIHNKAIGTAGTQINAGYLSEEYLYSLNGRGRADIFDRMRRSHHEIIMCYNSIKNPICGAEWDIEAADETPEAKADAEFIKFILCDDLNPTWDKFIAEAMTVVLHGHCYFEIVHKAEQGHALFGNYIGIKNIAYRSQRTIERFNVNREDSSLASITQYVNGDLSVYADIPAEFLLGMTINQEGANFEGISFLRPCYGPWSRQELYMKLNAIGIEHFAIPMPTAKLPPGQMDSDIANKFEEVLQKYVTHQNGYLLYPNDCELELNNNTYDPQKVETSIDNEDKRIAKACMANFLELGMNGTGSYALSNDLSDFFLGGIEGVVKEIKAPINGKLIPDIIKLNRGPRPKYPKLIHSGVSDKAGKEFADIISSWTDRGIITADDKLEDTLRKRIKLPKADITTRRILPAKSDIASVSSAFAENRILQKIRLSERRGY